MLLDTNTQLSRFIGAYGPTWRPGIISEHLELFVQAGGTHHASRSTGAGWAVVDGVGYPVLCSELVWVDTEDGRIDGRCGELALHATGTCHDHIPVVADEPEPEVAPNSCTPGQKCGSIDDLCTKHSAQYQGRWGRAANE